LALRADMNRYVRIRQPDYAMPARQRQSEIGVEPRFFQESK
jgi:hypothetical protein